jgi:hypothetical protein
MLHYFYLIACILPLHIEKTPIFGDLHFSLSHEYS